MLHKVVFKHVLVLFFRPHYDSYVATVSRFIFPLKKRLPHAVSTAYIQHVCIRPPPHRSLCFVLAQAALEPRLQKVGRRRRMKRMMTLLKVVAAVAAVWEAEVEPDL